MCCFQKIRIYLNFKGFRNAGFPHFLSLGDKILVLFSNEWNENFKILMCDEKTKL